MRLLFTALSASVLTSGLALANTKSSTPIVDLGYARYQGYHDPEFNANVYKG